MLELSSKEIKFLKKLNSPSKIQDFLDSIPFNHGIKKETCMSPRRVLRERRADCIEGAFLASVALWINKEEPLIINLKVEGDNDDDHIITLYKRNGYYGAISKTNHAVLRFRDPIYKTIRELVLSYFHEYFLTEKGEKTLRGYSKPINLKRFGTKWITREDDLFDVAEKIFDMKHFPIIPKENKKYIRNATPFERKIMDHIEWNKKEKKNS